VGGHSSKIHSVDWNSDGRRLASGSFDKCVCVFSLDRDKVVNTTCISLMNGYVINKSIWFWLMALLFSQRLEHKFRGHTDSVDQLCWHATHPDLLASASGDKTVRIWDSRSQKPLETFPTKGENINITWSPDGNTIAVGNKEDLITFIDVRAKKIRLEQAFKFEVNEICWNPTSDLFFLTNGLGCICIHRLGIGLRFWLIKTLLKNAVE